MIFTPGGIVDTPTMSTILSYEFSYGGERHLIYKEYYYQSLYVDSRDEFIILTFSMVADFFDDVVIFSIPKKNADVIDFLVHYRYYFISLHGV